MKKLDLSILVGFILAILFSGFTSFANECNTIRENVFRLHIMANSNNDADQQLKIAVRDALLLQTQTIFTNSQDKTQAITLASANLDKIKEIATEEIKKQGFDYPVRVSIVKMFFTTRQYGDVLVPAGMYDALRVEIGSGQGNNWWCVMFPPMCIPAVSDTTDATALESDIVSLGSDPKLVPSFAIVEWIESIKNKLK